MYDVAIIGAGFAGACIASELEGLDVIVIDKTEIGSKDVSAVTFTEIVENDDAIKNTYSNFMLMNTAGDSEKYEFEEDTFCLVDYQKLCRGLIDDVCKSEVLGYSGNEVILHDETIKAKIIVDCSGIGGEQLRVKQGFSLPPILNAVRFEKLSRVDFDDSTFCFIVGFANFGGWIYPEKGCVEFGMANRFKRGEEIRFPNLTKARQTGILINMLANAEASAEKSSIYPYGFVKEVVKGNVVIFGDSAGLTHPVYGMSLHYIHKLAPKLSNVINDSVRGLAKLSDYQKFWKSVIRKSSDLIARGYASWNLPIELQEKLTRLQIELKVLPDSMKAHMWALDEKCDFYAKKSPKLTDYPLRLYLKTLLYKIKLLI
jgi:flavin-dependent dehydrogenase